MIPWEPCVYSYAYYYYYYLKVRLLSSLYISQKKHKLRLIFFGIEQSATICELPAGNKACYSHFQRASVLPGSLHNYERLSVLSSTDNEFYSHTDAFQKTCQSSNHPWSTAAVQTDTLRTTAKGFIINQCSLHVVCFLIASQKSETFTMQMLAPG